MGAQPSSWNTHPDDTNEESKNRPYKFASIEFNMNLDTVVISRETYSILDWLGDIGGLNGILLSIFEIGIAPFAGFSLQRFLLTNMFRKRDTHGKKAV